MPLAIFGASRQPDRVAAAFRIFHLFGNDGEVIGGEQRTVFIGREARMIEWFSAQAADGLAVPRAAGKQQRPAGGGVIAENRKHPPLIGKGKMKEAVPRHDARKALV